MFGQMKPRGQFLRVMCCELARIGVDEIIFPEREAAEHLARLPQADLFLDTFPYGAHTTWAASSSTPSTLIGAEIFGMR